MTETPRVYPFTVFLLLPDAWLSETACAAQRVRRVWVEGVPGPDGTLAMIDRARDVLSRIIKLDTTDPEILAGMKELMEPVGLYPSHLVDLYMAP